MLKLICTKCEKEYLVKHYSAGQDTECPTCAYYRARRENYAALSKYNDALKDLQTRIEFLKDEGIMHEEQFQLALLGLSYLQNAAH